MSSPSKMGMLIGPGAVERINILMAECLAHKVLQNVDY